MTSKSGWSNKRSATSAGISSGAPSTASKRQKQGPRRPHLGQTGVYAGEKLSNSYSISHSLNLLFRGESQDACMGSKEFTQPGR